ncbi:MAG: Methionine aminopeptidase Map [Candidatus Methanohalarchaeum thermophilum]|uniref:Methionine aminopeptidase n=1 Tax=Methanohalarchaeum thermophilum TaxID=1903181 RepID=A0A1Q6DRW2_METT1|nr:MAG: Methionine aminopeptidase Map [Candidatus Methanohalarchaeum thermophilum]
MVNYDKYRKAGKILREVKKDTREEIEPGKNLFQLAEYVENRIREKGGKPAFPCNISLNEIAAHYTPKQDDENDIPEDALVTIDIGVHIDGYIADSAFTVGTEKDQDLIKATKSALEKAIKLVKEQGAGISVKKISETIEKEIHEHGYKPVANLTGHGLNRWKTHVDPTIPNISSPTKAKLDKGQVIAIEPFASAGSGRVNESGSPEIYSLAKQKANVRDRRSRKLLEHIKQNYKTLPFAKRWLSDFKRLDYSLKQLRKKNLLNTYSPLKDRSNGRVSQKEHTMIIKEKTCEVIT